MTTSKTISTRKTSCSTNPRPRVCNRAVATYERLEREAARPKRVVDHREAFERLVLVADVNGPAGDRIAFFCEQKRISVRSLVELGTRAIVEPNGGGVALVFGHPARVNG